MIDFARADIDAALSAAGRALERLALDAPSAALLDEARAALDEAPYLFVPLCEPPSPEAARALEGLVSLRLYLTHHLAHPWLAGHEARAALARQLIERLCLLEDELRADLPDGDAVALRYATVEQLHPSPPSLTGRAPSGDAALGQLLEAWERRDAERPPPGRHLAAKLRQHYLFYRGFFYAPAYALRRRRVRALLPRELRQSPAMLETFGAIEALGPILDNFVFQARGALGAVLETAIADMAFLYMQLADEVVDTVLHASDAARVRALVARLAEDPDEAAALAPFAALDGPSLASVGLSLAHPVPKYDATLGELIEALCALRDVIEGCLDSLADGPRHRRQVRAFFDHCFSTFIDELNLPELFPETPFDRLPLAETQWHGYRKNNLVMMRSIALRMALLDVPLDAHLGPLRAWGHVLASFQIFDDLKDLFVDLDKQPNYLLQLAATHYPEEHARLRDAAPLARRALDLDEPSAIARRAPRAVLRCVRLARLMAYAHFDWLTHYVTDYRWRRSWLVRARSFHLAPRGDSRLPPPSRAGLLETLEGAAADTRALREQLAAAGRHDEYLAYLLDVVAYEHTGLVLRAALPNLRLAYRFANLRMRMSAHEKAGLLRRVLLRLDAARRAPALLSALEAAA